MENPRYITLDQAKEAFCLATCMNADNEECNCAKLNLFTQKITDFSDSNEQNYYKRYLKVFLTTWCGEKEAQQMTKILKGNGYKDCGCISANRKEKTIIITVTANSANKMIERLQRSWAFKSVEEISDK